VTDLISEVAAASGEQSKGVEQVNISVAQMDKVTQQNAANAEETAATSEQLGAQAAELNDMLSSLVALVGGNGANGNGNGRVAALKETSERKYVRLTDGPRNFNRDIQGILRKEIRQGHSNEVNTPSLKVNAKTIKPEELIPLDHKDFRDF